MAIVFKLEAPKNRDLSSATKIWVLYLKCGGNMHDNLVELISNVGFPVAIGAYLLVRVEEKLDDLIKAFNDYTKES
ncbi:YvrJ family protein [Clostridium combesii]|nr:YvrJ family protein [Clostridium combesii]